MGMSTHVRGFVPPDDKWKKMKAAWDACKAAGAKVPHEVGDFFDWEEPNDAGMEVVLGAAVREWNTDSQSGYEVIVEKLPPRVKIVRVYNAW